MSAKFITSILSIGALITALAAASPVEARHDHDKAKRFLGTALGIYLLHQSLQNNHRRAPAFNHNRHGQKKYYNNSGHRKYNNYGHGKWKQKHYRRDCRQKIRGRDGRWYIVTGRC